MRTGVVALVGLVGLVLSACSIPAREAQKPPEGVPEAVEPGGSAEEGAAAAPQELAMALPEIEVVGLSERETLALLGPPAAKREQAPAKVWRYAGADCAVDVYFYLDIESNAFRALHLAGLEESTPADQLRQCLRQVYNDYQKP